MSATIRAARPSDARALAGIYNHYIEETVVTFEEEPVSAREMRRRLAETRRSRYPWLVAVADGAVVGYAYAGRWKRRSAYRFAAESTVYLRAEAKGRGIGTRLYRALFAALRKRRLHAVIGGIALPNPESVRLHEKFGFRKVAHFKEVGCKFGKWIDVGYWQAAL